MFKPSAPPHADWLICAEAPEPGPAAAFAQETGLHARRLRLGGREGLLFTSAPLPDPERFLLVEGVGNLGETPLSARPPGLAEGVFSGEARGCFTALARDGGALRAASDPLGLGHVYGFRRRGRLVLLSNRLHAAALAVRAFFPNAFRLDPAGVLSSVVFETPFDDGSLVDGVALLEAGLVCEIADGEVVERPRRRAPAPYAQGLERVVETLKENARAAAAEAEARGGRAVLFLSGGRDSRLVLAAAAAAGVLPRFARYTYGAKTRPDRLIARRVAALLGLPFEDARTPPVEGGIDALLDRWHSHAFGAKGVFRSGFFAEPAPQAVWLTGALGGDYRGFYTAMATRKGRPVGPRDRPRDLAATLLRIQARETLLTPAGRDLLEARLAARAFPEDEPPALAFDLLSHRFRARRHFGLALRASNEAAPTHAPLYSPAALDAAFSLDDAERAAGRLVYDAMRALHPPLAALPFDDGPWPPEAIRHAPGAARAAPPAGPEAAREGGSRVGWLLQRRMGEIEAHGVARLRDRIDFVCGAWPDLFSETGLLQAAETLPRRRAFDLYLRLDALRVANGLRPARSGPLRRLMAWAGG